MIWGKGFKWPSDSRELDSIPVGHGSHCIKSAAANVGDTPSHFRKVSGCGIPSIKERNFNPMRQQVNDDAELLLLFSLDVPRGSHPAAQYVEGDGMQNLSQLTAS